MQSTENISRQQFLLKKIESMLQTHQEKIKKLYKNQLAEVNKLQKNKFDSIKQIFEDYYIDRLVSAFRALDSNLDILRC
jgi:hypothetical protein